MDGRASYCVYATNNGNSTIWFPSELLQCWQIFVSCIMYIEHVIYARRVYISSRRVARTTRIQLHTALHVYYVYCTMLKHTNNSLIISTLLYIIVAYTYSIILIQLDYTKGARLINLTINRCKNGQGYGLIQLDM